MTETEFSQEIETIAGKVVVILEGFGPDDSITAWDLKLKLKVALSPLYMALGLLQERGRIRIAPDGLTYRVQTAGAPRASQPVVGVALQISAPSGQEENA